MMAGKPVERYDAGGILDPALIDLPDRLVSGDDMDPDILVLVSDSVDAVSRPRIDGPIEHRDDLRAAADAGHELPDLANARR